MRVLCAGFNLYGQFVKVQDVVVRNFTDCSYGNDIEDLTLSHTFLVASKGKDVFLHGAKSGKSGQIQTIAFPRDLEIAQIACSDLRILFLTRNGLLYKIDLNSNHDLVPRVLPNFLGETQEDRLSKIAVGSKISVALSVQGRIFNLPNELEFVNPKIVDIKAGCEHCLLLDSEGNVYSFGRGSRGQLGHGNLEDEPEPKQVEALGGINISEISTGGWHSCAISREGDLYTWGWNGNSQLGLGGVSVMASPHVIDFEGFPDSNIARVACGNRHTIALLDNGKLFGCGWNKYHQLGDVVCSGDNRDNENVCKMTVLSDLKGFNVNVKSLKCGPWSSVVFIE